MKIKKRIGYARVSTLEQARDSNALEQQKARVLNAEVEEANLLVDIVSGSKDDRPAFDQLLEMIRSGEIEEIVATRTDRLGRSLQQLLEIEALCKESGVNLRFIDQNMGLSTPQGKLMFRMLAMLAEWETDLLSERVRHGHHHRRFNHLAPGSCPWGYIQVNGKYALDDAPFLCLLLDKPENYVYAESLSDVPPIVGISAADLAREAIQLFLQKKTSRKTLECLFEKYGVIKPTHKYGGSSKIFYWTPNGFKRWLTKEVLQGHTAYQEYITVSKGKRQKNPDGPEIVRNTHPDQRLLTEQEAKTIKQILENNSRIGSHNLINELNHPETYREFAYLHKLVFCYTCGSMCTTKTSTSRGKKYAYYVCPYAGACSNKKNVRKSDIEKDLIEQLVAQSKFMREQVKEARHDLTGFRLMLLQLSGADDATIQKFHRTTAARYGHWRKQFGAVQPLDRLQSLQEQRDALDKIPGFSPAIERAKQDIDQEIAYEQNFSQSLLDRDAGAIIFAGNNLAFWDTLSNDAKVEIYSKVIKKIFIQSGRVQQIQFNIEPR